MSVCVCCVQHWKYYYVIPARTEQSARRIKLYVHAEICIKNIRKLHIRNKGSKLRPMPQAIGVSERARAPVFKNLVDGVRSTTSGAPTIVHFMLLLHHYYDYYD